MSANTVGIGIRAMLADQLAFIADPSHPRLIAEDNGRESLRMSIRATQFATSSWVAISSTTGIRRSMS